MAAVDRPTPRLCARMKALTPHLRSVISGPRGWEADETIGRAIEIRDGVIQNPKILSFQRRSAEFPHDRL